LRLRDIITFNMGGKVANDVYNAMSKMRPGLLYLDVRLTDSGDVKIQLSEQNVGSEYVSVCNCCNESCECFEEDLIDIEGIINSNRSEIELRTIVNAIVGMLFDNNYDKYVDMLRRLGIEVHIAPCSHNEPSWMDYPPIGQ